MNRNAEVLKRWLQFAENDLQVAQIINQSNPEFTSIIMFHCQQAIEKILKAYLVSKEIRFRKIHDLNKLLSMLENENWFSTRFYDMVDLFQKFNVEVRYPEGELIPTVEEAKSALEIAARMVSLIKEQIVEK